MCCIHPGFEDLVTLSRRPLILVWEGWLEHRGFRGGWAWRRALRMEVSNTLRRVCYMHRDWNQGPGDQSEGFRRCLWHGRDWQVRRGCRTDRAEGNLRGEDARAQWTHLDEQACTCDRFRLQITAKDSLFLCCKLEGFISLVLRCAYLSIVAYLARNASNNCQALLLGVRELKRRFTMAS